MQTVDKSGWLSETISEFKKTYPQMIDFKTIITGHSHIFKTICLYVLMYLAPKNWCFQTGAGKDLRVPWTARRSKQSIRKLFNPEYSLERLKLKLQYLGHQMWRAYSLEKTLMLGKTEGRRRRGWQSMRWLNGILTQWTWSFSKLWERVKDRGTWRVIVHRVAKSQTRLSDWTANVFCIQIYAWRFWKDICENGKSVWGMFNIFALFSNQYFLSHLSEHWLHILFAITN